MRIFLWIVAIVAVLGGAAVVVTSLPDAPWGQADPSPLGGGVALGAVGLTSGIALATSATYKKQREQATEALLREQRSSVYQELLTGMLRSFGGDLPDVTRERATVALWASPASMEALEAWFTFASKNAGDMSLPQKPELYRLLGQCVTQMRIDVGLDTRKKPIDQDRVLQMIFAKYQEEIAAAKRLLA